MQKVINQKIHCGRCRTTKGRFVIYCRSKKTGKPHHMCTKCNRERSRKYRKTKKGKLAAKMSVFRSIAKYPHKHLARSAVFYALKVGKLIKPKACSVCKKKKKVEAHHKDYARKLMVKWVCRVCHFDIHKKLAAK
jgi:hypothetical protein